MGERYLIDTNIIIYLLDGVLPDFSLAYLAKIIETESNISVVTQMEVLGYSFETISDENQTNDFINKCVVLQLDFNVVQTVIQLRKKHKLKLPDAIIAATAIVHNLTLITRNENDFSKITDLKITNPFNLS